MLAVVLTIDPELLWGVGVVTVIMTLGTWITIVDKSSKWNLCWWGLASIFLGSAVYALSVSSQTKAAANDKAWARVNQKAEYRAETINNLPAEWKKMIEVVRNIDSESLSRQAVRRFAQTEPNNITLEQYRVVAWALCRNSCCENGDNGDVRAHISVFANEGIDELLKVEE